MVESLDALFIFGGFSMGFGQLEVEFLLHEHRYQPFVGEALSIGRQAVAMKPEAMLNLLKAVASNPKIRLSKWTRRTGITCPAPDGLTTNLSSPHFLNAN